jgi:hypothetical protein
MTTTAERDRIAEVVQHARLFEASTQRGRERLDAALLHIDQAIALAGNRTNIPVTLPASVLHALAHPKAVGEGAYINAAVFVASVMRRAVSEVH